MPSYRVTFVTMIDVDVDVTDKSKAVKSALAKYSKDKVHYESHARRDLTVKRQRGGE